MTNALPFIPFARPDITQAEIDAVTATLRSGWLTTGPSAKKFEARLAEYSGVKHAIAVNSCTAALHLALEALGINEGDEVILPTLTFAATAEVVRYLKAKPVLVDSLPGDHNLDPQAVERAITPKTRAIIPVHYAGQAADMDRIMEIARAHRLPVIEDAAHAMPTTYKGRLIGGIGDITCFSFYATKPVATGEGGMIVTNRDDWADRMRIMSLHGISKDAWKRYTAEGSWYYEIIAPGYKYNLTDVAAALGLVQLDRNDEMHAKRAAIAKRYTAAFDREPALELPVVHDYGTHAWHLYVIRVRPDRLTIDRNRMIEELKAQGIGTSVHFIPLHVHPYYRDTYGYQPQDFPVAYDLYQRSISLPIFSCMTNEEVERVIAAVTGLVGKYGT